MRMRQMETGRQCRGRLWSSLDEVCTLLHLPAALAADSGELLFQHLRFSTGERVYRIGQAFENLYLVNSGFLKIVQMDEAGNQQVLGFPMKGDLLGADGICAGRCASEAVALSDCGLVVVPFRQLSALCRAHPGAEHCLHHLMSRELLQRQAVIGMLRGLSAEARVGRFLVALAERFVEMGYSSKLFNLRMTRLDIGSYLGMTLETVSRTLSALGEAGLITIHQRAVCINDIEALRNLRRLPPSRAHASPGRSAAAAPSGPADAPAGHGER